MRPTAELDPALTDEAECELLGMSHHTVHAVEFGTASKPASGWPYLTSIIRVAGLTGRRIELCGLNEDARMPPWLVAPDSGTGQIAAKGD